MSAIASKNLYDLLGNDPELDPNRAPDPPTKVADKPVQRAGKRNAGAEGPVKDAPRPAAAGRGGNQTRGDQAGSLNNRDDGARGDRRTREPREFRGGEGRGRGGRGGRGRGRGGAPRDDRHSHTGIGEHEKQAAHGWGGEDGNAEWADEKAGEAIARAEAKDDAGFTPDTSGQDPAFTNGPSGETAAEDVAAEPEEKTKSYDEYLAEQAEKRMALGENLSVRKANEGTATKFPEGKAFSREAQNYFSGSGGKAKKAKDAQDKKERVALDGQYYAAADSGDRGGRGGRGGRGRGRGEFRGERGAGRGRGRGDRGDRGDFRGGAPRGDRGGARGGFNAKDESAFPALGA